LAFLWFNGNATLRQSTMRAATSNEEKRSDMIKGFIYPMANRLLLQPLGRVTRGMTLGVRAVVRDDQGRFLVVKQSYTHGWIFPGGGVERGETPLESLARELDEEAAVKMTGQPKLHGLFSNHANFPGDYVAVYCVSEYEEGEWKATMEITGRAFLARDEIEQDCSDAMRRRLAELAGETEPAGIW
jgi:ADP-ribose pyrophosphatase YjhB (NUDIX family)